MVKILLEKAGSAQFVLLLNNPDAGDGGGSNVNSFKGGGSAPPSNAPSGATLFTGSFRQDSSSNLNLNAKDNNKSGGTSSATSSRRMGGKIGKGDKGVDFANQLKKLPQKNALTL